MTRGAQIHIGHAVHCKRPDPARYVHHNGTFVRLAGGRQVEIDMCPGCDQYVECRHQCWTWRTWNADSRRAGHADALLAQARAAQQRRRNRRANIWFTVWLLAVAVIAATILLHHT